MKQWGYLNGKRDHPPGQAPAKEHRSPYRSPKTKAQPIPPQKAKQTNTLYRFWDGEPEITVA